MISTHGYIQVQEIAIQPPTVTCSTPQVFARPDRKQNITVQCVASFGVGIVRGWTFTSKWTKVHYVHFHYWNKLLKSLKLFHFHRKVLKNSNASICLQMTQNRRIDILAYSKFATIALKMFLCFKWKFQYMFVYNKCIWFQLTHF